MTSVALRAVEGAAVHDDRPYLLVRTPDGTDHRTEVERGRVTVGRRTPGVHPDVVLEPDPQRWVGRVHCVFELVDGYWTVSDNATVNGTLLQREGVVTKIVGGTRLRYGDVVLILGDLVDGAARHWRMRLVDPFTTLPAPLDHAPTPPAPGPRLDYDWVTARVHRVHGAERTEIADLPPKSHMLLRCMVDRNRRNGDVAVVCSHDELRRALWGEPEEWTHQRAYTDQDVRDVVYQTRRRIEVDPGAPDLLETVRGFGYRLRSAASGAGGDR